MFETEKLIKILNQIDGKGYGAYKDIEGEYNFQDFTLYVDYVQGDPFAPPSKIRIRVPMVKAGFPCMLWKTKPRRIGLQDYITRQIAQQIRIFSKGVRETGKSGLIYIDSGGQEIIERTAMILKSQYVETRLSIGLSAAGRKITSKLALHMFKKELPNIVRESLYYQSYDTTRISEALAFVELKEDQFYIREELVLRKLVSFIADDSILPRASGVSQMPKRGQVVHFEAPSELTVEMKLPNKGLIKGMGIPAGVTLIVGGGYHGKSTLLKAIERGVYDHIPGDGREYAITRNDAVKIRAEDGRRVEKVNISPFINNLPFGRSTTAFRSEDASGSTSQAANIIEAMEIGTSLLLLDEDTSATNFMIRDARMQALVAKEKEPITPFVDNVRQLYRDNGISTVLVMGGSGDYFETADLVIMMDEYKPLIVTDKAKALAREKPTNRKSEGGEAFGLILGRIPLKQGFRAKSGLKTKVDAKGLNVIVYGNTAIDLSFMEQLVDQSQTRAIADLIFYASNKYVDNTNSLLLVIQSVFEEIEEKGLDVISAYYGKHPGDYAMPRIQEVTGAINRLRTLTVK